MTEKGKNMSIKNWWRKLTGKPETRVGGRPAAYIVDEMPSPIPACPPTLKQDLDDVMADRLRREAYTERTTARRAPQARTRTSQPSSRTRRSGPSYDSSSDFGGYVGYSGGYDSTPSPSSSGSDCGGSSYSGSSYDSGGSSSSSCDSGGGF